MYMYCTSTEMSGSVYSAEAYGKAPEDSYGEPCSNKGNWIRFFTGGTQLPITNSVFEDGFREGFIQGRIVDDLGWGSCLLWGLWSPDSIGYQD